jgi:hypothetical protein
LIRNPGHGSDILALFKKLLYSNLVIEGDEYVSVSGIMVSIAAFQAVDPGSIFFV